MPSYCSLFTTLNSVPFISDMELFKPYFEINSGDTSFDVVIKLPSNCYYIASSGSGIPSDGACGSSSDLNHVIVVDKASGCADTSEVVVSTTLNYSEDPGGNPINIYVIDAASGNSVKNGSKTKKKFHD